MYGARADPLCWGQFVMFFVVRSSSCARAIARLTVLVRYLWGLRAAGAPQIPFPFIEESSVMRVALAWSAQVSFGPRDAGWVGDT